MSAPDLSLPKGLALRPEDRALAAGEAIVIEEGIVDLFAVDDRGVRFPVAVLEKGDIAVGAASPVMLIAIPRQDAELGDAPSGQVDAAALSTFA